MDEETRNYLLTEAFLEWLENEKKDEYTRL